MVNTWNSYLRTTEDGRLLIPVVTCIVLRRTLLSTRVLITLGSSKIKGLHGPGTGFLIKGKAVFVTSGPDFDVLKENSTGCVHNAVSVESATQTI